MLVANQQMITLGKIRKGSPMRFKFTVTNTSDISVHIQNLSVGCGSCTQASTEKTLVEPNGKTDINVVFTPNSTGGQIKSVTVNTKEFGNIILKFSSEVI